MYSERLKTWIKKYTPNSAYRFLYRAYKYWEVFVLRRPTSVSLVSFVSPQFRTVQYGVLNFSILLNPENGSIDKEIFLQSSWEPDAVAIMQEYISPTSVCLDVGANIGHHTLVMALCAPQGSVHAFEPLPRLCAQIEKSIHQNGLKNIQVHPYALSNATSDYRIHTSLLNIGKATLDDRDEGGPIEVVSVKRFDDIWNGTEVVSFVKIDVEGHEYAALQGMEDMLRRDTPVIFFEYSPVFYVKNGTNARALLEFLFAYGYRIFDCAHNKEEITPDTLDTFMAACTFQTNLLCVPKTLYVTKN